MHCEKSNIEGYGLEAKRGRKIEMNCYNNKKRRRIMIS